jgi:hypothetical protein
MKFSKQEEKKTSNLLLSGIEMDWSYGLIKNLDDNSKIIFKSEELVCIRDLFPKSRNHFLIITLADQYDTIYDLDRSSIDIVEDMELMGINAIELSGHKMSDFKIGYHRKPSMKR